MITERKECIFTWEEGQGMQLWLDLTTKFWCYSHHSPMITIHTPTPFDQFLKTIGRTMTNTIMKRSMAKQVQLRVFFWWLLTTCKCCTPMLTKEFASSMWLSMLSKCSPWCWISTAMSMNTWCSSCRLLSISFIVPCLSRISWIVSMTLALPCCWMAFCKKVSLSPAPPQCI